jgi:hypothetical protein
MRASRGVLLVALGLLAIAALRDFARLGDALPWRQLYDFADFYCAGAALDDRADPYRYEPLHRCEHAVNPTAAYRADPRHVVPAPLPPYDFPPFMLAARLRFSLARTIDAVAIALAIAAAIWGLALARVPLDVAALSLALPAGYVLLGAGQVVPFALVSLVFCGVALARERDGVAGILAALTLVEPHLGLPVCAALLCWAPRSRIAIVAAVAALGIAGFLTTGVPSVVEYVTRVLPAQAWAETGYAYQYSLTYLVRSLGAPPMSALRAGELSYAAMFAVGVLLGRGAARSVSRRELIAYLPAATSVIAGPYVHMVDLAFAIPAALVLATSLEGRLRDVAAAALCLLAVPWIPAWIAKKLFLVSLFLVATLLLRLRVSARVSIGTFAAIAIALYIFELAPPAPLVATTAGAFRPGDFAEYAWGAYVNALGAPSFMWFAVKVPTWLGMSGLLGSAFGAVRKAGAPVSP